MASFHYKALQADGSVAEGQLDAADRREALRVMSARGLRPEKLTDAAATASAAPVLPARAVSPKAAPASGLGSGSASPKDATTANGASSPSTSGGVRRPMGAGSGRVASRPASRPAVRPAPVAKAVAKAASKSDAPAPGVGGMKLTLGGDRITPRILENFTRLLSSLLAAGVPLSRALVILMREAASPAAGAQWKQVHDLVVDGLSLAEAMGRSPKTFPRVYVAMVEAGETGGFLDVVLGQIADFQAREKEMRGKVMTALLYPVILLVLAIGVLVFLLVFFIPRFQGIFSGFGAELPLITQVIVGTSEVLRTWGILLLVALGVGGYSLRTWLVSEAGRRVWEGFILRAPVVGPLVAQFSMSRFCQIGRAHV